MWVSLKWLQELCGFELDASEVARRLTDAGVAVEEVKPCAQGLDGVVVAEVRGSRPHPARDKLTLVNIFDGQGEREIVCGAPNVPPAGNRVLLAQLGARLPGGLEISERKLGGVTSAGMLCGETELDIGSDDSGIVVLGEDTPAPAGTPIVEALSLADHMLELDLTPNRPDCLGHVGVARELCVIYGKPFALPEPAGPVRVVSATDGLLPQQEARFVLPLGEAAEPLSSSAGFSPVRVEIADAERCPRYGAALVSGVRIAPSPFALRYRLHVLGLRAINNVVDATNLILLGWGHPIHAFDYDKLRGSRIAVRRAAEGETMHTLDGQARALSADDLLICDGEGPVALAGVMGGQNSEIGEATTRVLIECAYFEPRSVRRTSKRTGLHTDSSHRFERGVDPQAVPAVLADAAAMIGRLGEGAVVAEALDVVASPYRAREVALRMARVEQLLGDAYDVAQAERYLTQLGCELSADGGELRVRLPSHRPDLAREIDLIEELARLRGYDSLPTELPAVAPSSEGSPQQTRVIRRLRELAAAAGLNEAVNFAFLAPRELELSLAPTQAVRIANPLSEERSVMRTALLPGLLQNLGLAQRQQLDSFAAFELARVFRPHDGEALPRERYQLSLLLWGQRAQWVDDRSEFDFYDGKGAIEAIVRPLCGVLPHAALDQDLAHDAPFLHPKRRARVWLGERKIGVLGELSPDVVEASELAGRPVYAVLEVSELEAAGAALGPSQARPLPRFPAVTRDLSLEVEEALEAREVAEALAAAAGGICEKVALFDIYRGGNVPQGRKSLSFRVVYREPEATLTDKQVDKAHAKVLKAAQARFGSLR